MQADFDLGDVEIMLYAKDGKIDPKMMDDAITAVREVYDDINLSAMSPTIVFMLNDEETNNEKLDELFVKLQEKGIRCRLTMIGYHEAEGGYLRDTEVSKR